MMIKERCIGLLDRISEWSLYVMIFTLPFSKSMIEVTIVIAIVSTVIKKILSGERLLEKNAVNICLGIFLLASLISIFNSQYLALSVRAFFTKILKFAALFLVAKEIINTRRRLSRFALVALASCLLILADASAQYFFFHVDLLHSYPAFNYRPETPWFLGAPTASFPFPNDFAAWILVLIFPAGSYAAFGRKGRANMLFLAAIFFSLLYFLILTKVRGAWISFVGGMALLGFLKPKTVGIILLVLLVLGCALMYKDLMPYAASFTSVHARGAIWETGWGILKEHPIIGNGVNTFFNKFKMARQDAYQGKKGSYAHNCYLQMACDTGLLGLFAFFAFVLSVLYRSCRSLKSVKDPALYSLILGTTLGLSAFLLHSAVDTNLYSLPLAALFWLSSGVLLGAVKISDGGR